ncbi:adenylate/guanylate cyclase domain-containing protein [uncultured Desulfosarcina sp.]|uniref:adenylate/guanylate cyclase domain-containing protein n=1 Tax=uncultured Desulfosarcina sp. TaxID=218289 RepID=UPI0029C969C7|nr:adenylate/guanylate cyclase domain-containing protein [uncultured Desulfosarcina sp.]
MAAGIVLPGAVPAAIFMARPEHFNLHDDGTAMRRSPKNLVPGIRHLFRRRSPGDVQLGQVLIDRGVITAEQLEAALAEQRKRLIETGQAVRLGHVITDLGLASEEVVVEAINENFRLSVASLSDNIRELILRQRGPLAERLPPPAIPIWLKLCIGALLIVTVTIVTFSTIIINKQKARLFDQTVMVGTVSLNYFANNARIPLIDDDILSLNTLIKEATDTEGLRYAVVTDAKGLIRAHTDVNQIGTPLSAATPTQPPVTRGKVSYYSFVTPSGEQMLNLYRDVVFQDKILGTVHVGVSLDFIEHLVAREKGSIIYVTLVMMIIGLAIAVYLGLRFSRPITQLVAATEAIGKGDYRYRVELNRQDELGNLATAFNQMGEELLRHTLTRQSFGKYVGEEVLEMIIADPEKMWLKGHKNDATILFADIRGFTAYAEAREPERVVEMLNTYFDIATRAILDYGGYVDKFIGDGVLGVFGVPVYRNDHVERTVRAALDLMDQLRSRNVQGNPLLSSVGIGIHTGPVVSGNIGSPAKMEYTVIGDTVNLASRLSSLACPGEVLVTDAVVSALRPLIQVEPAGSRAIKGKTAPVETFRVLSIKQRSHVKSTG